MTSSGPSHRQVWDALPWILNGSASEDEQRSVQKHLRGCADCRDALAFEQRVHDALTHREELLGKAEAGWQRLSNRIDGGSGSGRRLSAGTVNHWLAAAVVVEALALGVLVNSSWLNRAERVPAGDYRTLSQPGPVARPATIRVVLTPDMTLGQFRALLSNAHLQVVAGPGNAGVWSLAPTEDVDTFAAEASLRELRASAQVRFAEPVNGGAKARSP